MSTAYRPKPGDRPGDRPKAGDRSAASRKIRTAATGPESRASRTSGTGGPTGVARILSRMNVSLRGLSPRGKVTLAVVAALVVGLIGFTVGLLVGRPGYPGDGSAEVGFARDMSAHHAQAVEMGMIAFQNATHEEIRVLGGDIAMTQKSQIGTMQGWLTTWGVPTNTDERPMAWIPGSEAMLNGNLMPGMATREEIDELQEATGEQVDILFLQLMIRHHVGGSHMIEGVLAQDPLSMVREFVEMMATHQGGEVVVMQNYLEELGAEQLPD